MHELYTNHFTVESGKLNKGCYNFIGQLFILLHLRTWLLSPQNYKIYLAILLDKPDEFAIYGNHYDSNNTNKLFLNNIFSGQSELRAKSPLHIITPWKNCSIHHLLNSPGSMSPAHMVQGGMGNSSTVAIFILLPGTLSYGRINHCCHL